MLELKQTLQHLLTMIVYGLIFVAVFGCVVQTVRLYWSNRAYCRRHPVRPIVPSETKGNPENLK